MRQILRAEKSAMFAAVVVTVAVIIISFSVL